MKKSISAIGTIVQEGDKYAWRIVSITRGDIQANEHECSGNYTHVSDASWRRVRNAQDAMLRLHPDTNWKG